MTIYFASGETFDYDAIGTYTTAESTTSGRFRSVARTAIQAQSLSSNLNTAWLRATLPTSLTSLWLTFRCFFLSSTSSSGYVLISFGKSGIRRLGIAGSGTLNKIAIVTKNAALTTTTLVNESGTYAANTLYKFDLQIINYGASGTVNLYRANSDGTGSSLIATFTGDLTTDGETSLDQIFIGGTGNGLSTYLSEIVVSSTDTRGIGLITSEPLANGNAFNFTGSFADVDDTSGAFATIDADLITANADNDLSQVTLVTSRIGTPSTVAGVVISHRSRAGGSIPNVTPNLRLGGTNYFGTQITPPAGFSANQEVFETNPNTGLPFLYTDLTAAGVNYGLRANT